MILSYPYVAHIRFRVLNRCVGLTPMTQKGAPGNLASLSAQVAIAEMREAGGEQGEQVRRLTDHGEGDTKGKNARQIQGSVGRPDSAASSSRLACRGRTGSSDGKAGGCSRTSG